MLVANARLPSQRAQSLQVVQTAAAFARAGAATTLCYARRRPTPVLRDGTDLWTHYGCAPGPRPALVAVPCIDWIERVPRAWQYAPARVQELSFARNAARCVLRAERRRKREAGPLEPAPVRVLSREAECALALVRRGHADVFLELHRVPGGTTRRRWLVEAARGCRGVVAISGGVRDDLAELGVPAERIVVEHDGFEPARFAATPTRAAARAALGLDPERALVVYTGGLLAWKGVDVLVDAARALPDTGFAIAGGMDADVAALRAHAAGLANVRIDGFQAPERVPLYLAAADLGVVPNRSQPAISARYTSPLKAFEMMAVGLPMVASDLPSLREVLGEDEALFVAPDDAAALASGIAALLADGARRRAMAGRLRGRAGEHGWDARAERILSWMERTPVTPLAGGR